MVGDQLVDLAVLVALALSVADQDDHLDMESVGWREMAGTESCTNPRFAHLHKALVAVAPVIVAPVPGMFGGRAGRWRCFGGSFGLCHVRWSARTSDVVLRCRTNRSKLPV